MYAAGADTIRPRNLLNLIAAYFVGRGDLDAPMPHKRHKILELSITDRLWGQPLRLSAIGAADTTILICL